MKTGDKLLDYANTIGSPRKGSRSDEIPLDLARAMLLVDLALIDSKFDSREYLYIMHVLKTDLSIGEAEAAQLIKSASDMLKLRGSNGFAEELKNRLPLEQRKKLAAEMKQLISVDDNEDGFEIYLVNRLRSLLGVDDPS